MASKKAAEMRTRPWLLTPRRAEKVVLQRESSPKPRRNKDLSKVKCFACHEYCHYASQCPQQKRGGRKQQASCNVPNLASLGNTDNLMYLL
jgi:hypothetical protein